MASWASKEDGETDRTSPGRAGRGDMHLPRCSLESSERSASSEIPCLRLAAADGEGQWQRWEESGWPRDPHDLNDGVTGDVQRALNATKKAEHRLGRLMQDREKATLQWQEYAKASKAAYYKEKERYMKALQNYDRDIHEAQAAQNEARRALRDQVAGVYKSEQVPIRRLASVGLLVQDPPCESQTVAWHLALPGVCRSGFGDVERDLVHAW